MTLSQFRHRWSARDSDPLVELRDLLRLPVWVVSKLVYAFAPPSIFFRVADMRGATDWSRPRVRRDVLSQLERHLDAQCTRDLRLVGRRYMQSERRTRVARLWPQIRGFAGAESIAVEGLEHLSRALDEQRGVILLSAHYGHARLIKPILRSRGLSPLLVGTRDIVPDGPALTRVGAFVHDQVLQLPRRSTLDKRWNETVGTDLIVGINLREYLAALADGRILIILADGSLAHVGCHVSILGIQVRLASGAVQLARYGGVPTLPTFVVDEPRRIAPARLRLLIGSPLELQVTNDIRADLRVNLQRFSAAYEDVVRRYPHNWRWSWVRDGALGEPAR